MGTVIQSPIACPCMYKYNQIPKNTHCVCRCNIATSIGQAEPKQHPNTPQLPVLSQIVELTFRCWNLFQGGRSWSWSQMIFIRRAHKWCKTVKHERGVHISISTSYWNIMKYPTWSDRSCFSCANSLFFVISVLTVCRLQVLMLRSQFFIDAWLFKTLNPTISRLVCFNTPCTISINFLQNKARTLPCISYQEPASSCCWIWSRKSCLIERQTMANVSATFLPWDAWKHSLLQPASLQKVHNLQDSPRLMQIQTHLKGFGIGNQHLKSRWANSMQNFAHESWQETQNIAVFCHQTLNIETKKQNHGNCGPTPVFFDSQLSECVWPSTCFCSLSTCCS